MHLVAAKRRIAERQDQIEAGQVARIAPMVRFLQAVLVGMRNRLLSLPGETAFQLAMRPQEEVFEVLNRAVRDKLEEIADPASAAADAAAAGLADAAAEIAPQAAVSGGDDDDDGGAK
jgi:hypothetical protein